MACCFGWIKGVVRDGRGLTLIEDCVVALEGVSQPDGRRTLGSQIGRTDAEGMFEFSRLAPGKYELWVLSDANNRVVRKQNIEVGPGVETYVEIVVRHDPEETLVPLWLVSDHQEMASQALDILANDNNTNQSIFLKKWLRNIQLGESTADDVGLIPGLYHFYHWSTGEGKGGQTAAATCMNAASVASSYWSRFVESPGNSELARSAMRFLGEAAHCVQDVCQPHHANLTNWPESVHGIFESYVHMYYSVFAGGVSDGGIYEYEGDGMRQWVIRNARTSCSKYGSLVASVDPAGFSQTAEDMIPIAKRTKAGFFKFMLETRFKGWEGFVP